MHSHFSATSSGRGGGRRRAAHGDRGRQFRLPADFDAVTAMGEGDHSEIDDAAVDRIWPAARHWSGRHAPAIQLCIPATRPRRAGPRYRSSLGNPTTDSPDAEHLPITTDTPFWCSAAPRAVTATAFRGWSIVQSAPSTTRSATACPATPRQGWHRPTIRHLADPRRGYLPRPQPQRAQRPRFAERCSADYPTAYRPGLVPAYPAR